jgi:hypothetical protein
MIRGFVAIPSSPSFWFTGVPKDADFEVTCDMKASTMTKHSDTGALDQVSGLLLELYKDMASAEEFLYC